jgi:CBS domain-containing protein
MEVREVMTRHLVTVGPTATLKEAAPLFLEHRISGLPVVDRGRLVGVLSESDIVAKETSGYANGDLNRKEAMHVRRERGASTVGEAMTTEVVTVEPWVSIWAAADLMVTRDVNRLPVVDTRTGQLLGLVTRDDLVRAFARSDSEIASDIRERLLPSVGLGPASLDLRVEHGVVTISGEVESSCACECLHQTLHLVPGVVRVDWNVTWTGARPAPELAAERT